MKFLILTLVLFLNISVVNAETKECTLKEQKKGFCGNCDEVAYTTGMCEYKCILEEQKKGFCGNCDEVEHTAGMCEYTVK